MSFNNNVHQEYRIIGSLSGGRAWRLVGMLVLLAAQMAQAQLEFRDTSFRSIQDTASTVDVDLITIPDRIILQTGTNTNLALNKEIVVRYANPDPLKVSTHPTASNPSLMIDGKIGRAHV